MKVRQGAVSAASDNARNLQLRSGRGGIPMRLAIGLIVLFALIVPLTVAWSLTYRQIFRNEIDRAKEHHVLLARSVASELERFHYEISQALEEFGPEIVAGETPLFADKFLKFRQFRQFCVFDRDSFVLTREFMQGNMGCSDVMPLQNAPLIRAMLDEVEPGKAAETGVQLLKAGPGLLFALEHGESIVVAALTTEFFSELQRPITFGKNAHLAIVDRSGRILAHPNPEWERMAKDVSDILESGGIFKDKQGVAEFYSPAFASDMVAGYARVDGAGWGVMVPQPISDLRAIAKDAAAQSFGALLIGAIVAIAVALGLSKYLEAPVKRVSEAFNRLSDGGGRVAMLDGSSIRELNVLSHSFNGMAVQIERGKLFEKRLRQKAEENLTIAKQLADSERELRLQQEGQAQRDRLEALGRVVGGVAHDFNNILNVILGNAELIDEIRDPKETPEFTREIISATQRGSALTKQLLAYGRRSHLEPKPHTVKTILDRAIATARRLLPETFAISVSYDDALPQIMVDQNHFSIMILNLLTNARDASTEKAQVEVHVTAGEPDAEILKGGQFGLGQKLVRISVVDHGAGMSEDTLARSGDPFFTTKMAGAGSGLGLPMIIGFVEQSGGVFDITSRPGVGTRVQIYFPVAHVAEQEFEVAGAVQATSRCQDKVKVLIVEDEGALSKMLDRQLSAHGFSVKTAPSGDAARALIEAGLEVDVLVSDVVMPGEMQGFALARWAKAQRPDLKAVVMSGFPRDETCDAHKLGEHAVFLRKPSTIAQILDAIQQLVDPQASPRQAIPA